MESKQVLSEFRRGLNSNAATWPKFVPFYTFWQGFMAAHVKFEWLPVLKGNHFVIKTWLSAWTQFSIIYFCRSILLSLAGWVGFFRRENFLSPLIVHSFHDTTTTLEGRKIVALPAGQNTVTFTIRTRRRDWATSRVLSVSLDTQKKLYLVRKNHNWWSVKVFYYILAIKSTQICV